MTEKVKAIRTTLNDSASATYSKVRDEFQLQDALPNRSILGFTISLIGK
jgi:hypothetical protein